jgi:hypothetical protein
MRTGIPIAALQAIYGTSVSLETMAKIAYDFELPIADVLTGE